MQELYGLVGVFRLSKLLKNSHINTEDDDRLVGAALFPVDFGSEDRDIIPQHPWACSLRTRGFRGRHRCGVTLLSGRFI